MQIKTTSDFGNLVRVTRKLLNMTQPELAGACGTGLRFIVDLEKGKPTCEIEKVLTVASMLGIRIEAVVPDIDAGGEDG